MKLILDPGNALIKWYLPSKNRFNNFRHSIAYLTDNDWRHVVGRHNTPPVGIARINGQAVAFGDAAVRHQIAELPRGAARYTREYYGLIMAYVLSEAVQSNHSDIELFTSHAPGDFDYVPDIIQAAIGEWVVESRYGILEFSVLDVATFDEPFGGYSHAIFNPGGTEREDNPLRGKMVLVVDVGGYTVDTVAIDGDGHIDNMSIGSTRTGVIDMVDTFVSEVRTNNRTLFKTTRKLDPRRVENALITGTYQFGNTPVDCQQEAQEGLYTLGNEVSGIIDKMGGPGNFDIALITGGGAALLHDTLSVLVPRLDFLAAEPRREYMHYANVFGGAKLSAALSKMR